MDWNATIWRPCRPIRSVATGSFVALRLRNGDELPLGDLTVPARAGTPQHREIFALLQYELIDLSLPPVCLELALRPHPRERTLWPTPSSLLDKIEKSPPPPPAETVAVVYDIVLEPIEL